MKPTQNKQFFTLRKLMWNSNSHQTNTKRRAHLKFPKSFVTFLFTEKQTLSSQQTHIAVEFVTTRSKLCQQTIK